MSVKPRRPKKEYCQISVRFSAEQGWMIQQRAEKHGRSCSKEIVQLVQAQLAQEASTYGTKTV